MDTYRHTLYGIRNYNAGGRATRPTYFGHTNPAACNHNELANAWSLASSGHGRVLVDWCEDGGAAGVDWWPSFVAA